MGTGAFARAAVFAGSVLTGLTAIGSAGAAEALALIAVSGDENRGMLAISASVLATAGATVSGELVVKRQGAAGIVSSRYARNFVLSAGSTGTIGELAVSFTPSDSLDVVATVYKDGIAISRATLSTSDLEAPGLSGGIN